MTCSLRDAHGSHHRATFKSSADVHVQEQAAHLHAHSSKHLAARAGTTQKSSGRHQEGWSSRTPLIHPANRAGHVPGMVMLFMHAFWATDPDTYIEQGAPRFYMGNAYARACLSGPYTPPAVQRHNRRTGLHCIFCQVVAPPRAEVS